MIRPIRTIRTIRTIRSPCVDICRLERATGSCAGCHRTIDEIANWGQMSDAERDRIMAELPLRGMAQPAERTK